MLSRYSQVRTVHSGFSNVVNRHELGLPRLLIKAWVSTLRNIHQQSTRASHVAKFIHPLKPITSVTEYCV